MINLVLVLRHSIEKRSISEERVVNRFVGNRVRVALELDLELVPDFIEER